MKKRILYIAQELSPFLNVTEISEKILELATFVQRKPDFDVRIFIPRYGCVNQRRHQLHEVIRLSGINLVINDIDQPLIIKVGSVQKAKLQVYFIDNDEYFKRKGILKDSQNNPFKDNDERMMFFCQGVLESLIMLRWSPDIIHCNGWITGLIPLYLHKKYNTASVFENTKILYSIYKDSFKGSLNKRLKEKVMFDEIEEESVLHLTSPTAKNLHKQAIQFSDFVDPCKGFNSKDVLSFIKDNKVPTTKFGENNSQEELVELYNNMLIKETV